MSVQIQARPWPYRAYPTLPPLSSYATASLYQRSLEPDQPSIFDSPSEAPSILDPTNAYMNPTLPQPPLQQSFHTSPNHGIKRSAPDPDDEFDRSNHISSQLKKLRLNNNSNNGILGPSTPNQHHTDPVVAHSFDHGRPAQQQQHQQHHPQHDAPTQIQQEQPSYQRAVPTLPSNDFMTVDDTPHKIYISDLDGEIASIEAAERCSSTQLFLPDFEKQIGAIPDHVLRSTPSTFHNSQPGGEGPDANQQALVLYKDPSSISVPEEEDAVRKVVLETRRGIRERMRKGQQREREMARVDPTYGGSPVSPVNRLSGVSADPFNRYKGLMTRHYNDTQEDDDAMEIE